MRAWMMNGRRVVREPCQSKTYRWGETEWQAREERGKMTQVTEEKSENDWEETEMPGCLCLLWLVLMALGQLGWWADESETVCWGEKKPKKRPKKASFSIVTSEQKKKKCVQQQRGIFESWPRRTLKHASSESRKKLYEVSVQDRKEETNKMTRRTMRKGLNEGELNHEANVLLAGNYRKTISRQHCSHLKWHVALTSERKSKITNLWIEEIYRSSAITCRKMVHNVKVN